MIIVEKTVIVDETDLMEGVQGTVFNQMKHEVFTECLTADIVVYQGRIVKNRLGALVAGE